MTTTRMLLAASLMAVAVENLNPLERGWLRDVCRRQGLALTNLDSDHPRVVRTAAYDEDEE